MPGVIPGRQNPQRILQENQKATGTKPSFKAPAQGSGAPNVKGDTASPCLISWPKASAPLVGSVGGGCILSKTNVRAMAGGILLGGGAALTAVGLILLVAAGFKRTGALGQAASVAGVIPGGQPVAAGLRGAQARVSSGQRTRPTRRQRGALEDIRLERAVGEPRENANLREGRGAVRETPAGTRRRRTERDRPPF